MEIPTHSKEIEISSELKISQGNPTKNGAYVCYIKHQFLDDYPEKEILMWIEGRWGYRMSDQFYRGEVYGWIGPLPSPTVKDLGVDESKYAICFFPDGNHGAFIGGPFDTLEQALDEIGEKGHYIAKVHPEKDAIPVKKWSEKKMKWIGKKK